MNDIEIFNNPEIKPLIAIPLADHIAETKLMA